MNGDQARRAGGIDGHGWAMPVEEVGDAVGDDASRRPRGHICWHTVNVALQVLAVVIAHQTNVNARCRANEGLHGDARRFQRFVDSL